MSKIHLGGDIVSGASKIAEKLGVPLKNWHLPGHKITGPFTELEKELIYMVIHYPDMNPLIKLMKLLYIMIHVIRKLMKKELLLEEIVIKLC